MNFQDFKKRYQKIKPEEIAINPVFKPLVSVCIQTYQHADFVKDCLEGILMQEVNFHFEILLGEDDSTDGTREICIEYAKKYPNKIRLFLHHRENNIKVDGKPTGRFNFMYNIFSARGNYVALCEGDDYWTDPLKLQKQVDALEKDVNYVLCFHPCRFFLKSDESNEVYFKEQPLKSIDYNYSVKNLLVKWNIPTASILFRNKIDDFPQWFTQVASGDIALVMLLYQKGKFRLLQEPMSVYSITGKGISESHVGYRMIHYRTVLYSHLNTFFKYKYEKEIYEALKLIIWQYSEPPKVKESNNRHKFPTLSQFNKKLMHHFKYLWNL